jgi:nitrogen regulatory protein PII
MHAVKRIEVIATTREVDKLLAGLDEVGVPGYTVIRDVVGKSRWGKVSDDFDLAGTTLSNSYILCFCPAEDVKPVLEAIQPLLNKYGGVCYVSDAMAVRSTRCIASL